MKASAAICSAIVCASSVAGPMSPIARVAAQKTPTSAAIVAPIGRPSFHKPAISRGARTQGRAKSFRRRKRGSISEKTTSNASMSVCDSVVARPEPTMPKAGRPNLPKMSA